MKNRIAIAMMLTASIATYTNAQEIEEIVVMGTTMYETESNPSTDVLLLESLIPEAHKQVAMVVFLVIQKEERKQYTRVFLEMESQQMMQAQVGMTLDMTTQLAVKQLKLLTESTVFFMVQAV